MGIIAYSKLTNRAESTLIMFVSLFKVCENINFIVLYDYREQPGRLEELGPCKLYKHKHDK